MLINGEDRDELTRPHSDDSGIRLRRSDPSAL